MIIGLEAERANLPQPTGVERYAAELIKNLAKLDSANTYRLYFRTKPQAWFYQLPKNFELRVMPFPKFWTQIRLSWELFFHPVDVLMILASVLPIYHPKHSVFTAHDIAYEMFPDSFTPFMLWYLRWSTRFAVRHAEKIVAVSQATKNDMVKIYKAEPEKIFVTHLGLDQEKFKPLPYEQVQPVLDKYGLIYQKYVLFLGTIQPRKNIVRLVEAYENLRSKYHVEEKLAIFGGKGWMWKPILERVSQAEAKGAVKYFDYAESQDLSAIIAGAKLLTLPALYEGFGLPPLEAMASGVPVVVSNVSSMPEVAGDAGLLVDPNFVDSITEGLLKVMTDPNLRKAMIDKGLSRAKDFTWENTAKKTLELLEQFNLR
ncbi:MAG: glycosyltransferase family 4 protein [Acidobacteriaceae bacterium]